MTTNNLKSISHRYFLINFNTHIGKSRKLKMASWKDCKARRQVKESDLPDGVPPQNGTVFNQWYNKWSHGTTSSNSRFVSPFRLDTGRDSGTTAARSDCQVFCLYFARGCCALGSKCQYLHHVPDPSEDSNVSRVKDCFGREKHSQYRDDMSGVGSFQSLNSTLYIGGITNALNGKPLKPIQIENRLKYVLTPLGPLEKIRYIENKNCAFIKFKDSINAEFAKEVISNQTLLLPNDKEWDRKMDGMGLLVKWAHEDPDPNAKKRRAQEQHQSSLKLMESLLQNYEGNIEDKISMQNNNNNNSNTKSKESSEPTQKRPRVEPKRDNLPTALVSGYDSDSSDSD